MRQYLGDGRGEAPHADFSTVYPKFRASHHRPVSQGPLPHVSLTQPPPGAAAEPQMSLGSLGQLSQGWSPKTVFDIVSGWCPRELYSSEQSTVRQWDSRRAAFLFVKTGYCEKEDGKGYASDHSYLLSGRFGSDHGGGI